MMAFLLFLFVFMITYNNGTARPMIDSDVIFLTRNGMDGDNDMDDRMIFKIPTPIKQGTSIHINGILNTNNTMFRVTLGDDDEPTEDCKIMLYFDTNTITVTPAINGYGTASYELHLNEDSVTNEVQSTFSLRIIARVNDDGKEMLAVHFQVNEEGESPQLICDIKSYEAISYIEVQEGVARVASLFFEFKENR